jgi:UDP-N-acetylmuramate dehydrogenase
MKIKENVPLAPLTSFGIGGAARFFFEPENEEELREALEFAKRKEVPFAVLGGGTNILVKDSGFSGLIIRLSGDFKRIEREGDAIIAGAAAPLSSLINQTVSFGLSGLEMLSGIPGTVGGAVIGNAGSFGTEIENTIKWVDVVRRDGEKERIERPRFSYRNSSLREMVVLRAGFSLKEDAIWRIEERREYVLKRRAETQPLSAKTAGCIFKNPKGISAAALIEEAGLADASSGDAAVSKKHKNFIENRGNAKATDVLNLIEMIKRGVYERFKVRLEEEIVIV